MSHISSSSPSSHAIHKQEIQFSIFPVFFLGSHFESLGNASQTPPSATSSSHTVRTQENSNATDIKVHSSTDPRQATAADEAKMKKILSDPKIQEAFRDEEIQRLFAVLKTDPNEAQRYGIETEDGLRIPHNPLQN